NPREPQLDRILVQRIATSPYPGHIPATINRQLEVQRLPANHQLPMLTPIGPHRTHRPAPPHDLAQQHPQLPLTLTHPKLVGNPQHPARTRRAPPHPLHIPQRPITISPPDIAHIHRPPHPHHRPRPRPRQRRSGATHAHRVGTTALPHHPLPTNTDRPELIHRVTRSRINHMQVAVENPAIH